MKALKPKELNIRRAATIANVAAWVLLSAPQTGKADDALIINGSFEIRKNGVPPAHIEHLKPGSAALKGWVVLRQDPRVEAKSRSVPKRREKPNEAEVEGDQAPYSLGVDWIGPTRWKAAHGDYCLDLDGGVRQIVRTIAGESYQVQFDLAGNPELGASGPTKQTLRVMVDDRAHDFTFDSTGKTTADLGWTPKRVVFTANTRVTVLTFFNPHPNLHSAGVALDNVSVRRLCPYPDKKTSREPHNMQATKELVATP